MGKLYLSCFAAAAALFAAAAAHAAPVGSTPPAVSEAVILLPATMTKTDDLDFALLSVTTAGTAILNATTETITTTGGVMVQGGQPHAARFIATAPSKNVLHITLPKQAITLTRVGGTETMTADTWTLNGLGVRNVLSKEQIEIKVGATLHVNANQVEGVYIGTFDVSINYN